jgi:triacylglycerol lipase
MAPLARDARRLGYGVLNWGYPSRTASIAEHAERLDVALRELAARGARPIHLVTHSLGGVIVRACIARAMAATPTPSWRSEVGRVVMLAPPNAGSPIVDRLREYGIFSRVLGPAALELGTDEKAVPIELGPWPREIELGIIAGTTGSARLLGAWVQAPHDGKVSVESARLEGMKAFLTVRRGHTFIMAARDVRQSVFSFLEIGAFPGAVPLGDV